MSFGLFILGYVGFAFLPIFILAGVIKLREKENFLSHNIMGGCSWTRENFKACIILTLIPLFGQVVTVMVWVNLIYYSFDLLRHYVKKYSVTIKRN